MKCAVTCLGTVPLAGAPRPGGGPARGNRRAADAPDRWLGPLPCRAARACRAQHLSTGGSAVSLVARSYSARCLPGRIHLAPNQCATTLDPTRSTMPNIVLLQPVAYGGDKLLMRFELDAPLPSGAHVDTYINGKFAGSFQRQDGCIVIDKPIKGTSCLRCLGAFFSIRSLLMCYLRCSQLHFPRRDPRN